MENVIGYFIDLYQQSQSLSLTRKQVLQNDLRNLIAKLTFIKQTSNQVNYKFEKLQYINFESLFSNPEFLVKFRNYVDHSVDNLISNLNDFKAYQEIFLNLENLIYNKSLGD